MEEREAQKRLRAATTAGPWVHVLIRTLESRGLDGERMAIEAGIALRNIRNERERVPQIAMTRFWKLAVEATADSSLGLHVARSVTGATFDALGHATFVSATLEAAFRRVVRFQRLMTDSLDLDFVLDKDRYRLEIRAIAPNHPPAEEIDGFCATWVRVTRGMAPVDPVRVHLRRPRPPDAALFRRVFRAPIRFGARGDFIEYDRSDCERPLSDANLDLVQEYEQILARQAARLENATLADKVRAVLFEIMADGPSEAAVAERLCMSKSSLKMSLARESISYKGILEDVRRTLARRYLRENGYSIKETAFLLGYADAATFARAFKRWTGKTPRGK